MTDQFYTLPNVAVNCLNIVKDKYDLDDFDFILEPSAGTGSFYNILPEAKSIGLDIDPKCDGVAEQDFLEYNSYDITKRYLVIGNPPFGRVSSLAVKFFNKAAEFAHVIAFIIPRTFKKVSIHNRLNLMFNMVYSVDLSVKPCCFDPPMSAKCCFQIWERSSHQREKVHLRTTCPDFDFLKLGPKDEKGQPTPPTEADIAVKAYGSGCGKVIVENLHELRPKSWHFLKSNVDVNVLIQKLQSLDYTNSKETVRQDSLGRSELVELYMSKYLSSLTI
jgi:hypothetical protein